MALRWMEKLILAKIESVYGTDPTPAAGTNDILTRDFQIQPVQGERRDRALDRPNLGASPLAVTQVRRTVTFKVELAGSGAAGTAPKYDPLLLACGFDATVNIGVEVEYDPSSDEGDSLTIYFNVDGRLMKLQGARGAVGFEFNAGDYPYLTFSFTGLYAEATDAAQGTPTYTGWQKPLEVNNDNTGTFSIHGYSGVLQSLVVQPGQQVSYRNLVGQEAVRITGRSVRATASIILPTVADLNIEQKITGEALAAVQLIHGGAAGAIVQLDASYAQIVDYSLGENQGDAMANLELLLTAWAAGDDELKLTVK